MKKNNNNNKNRALLNQIIRKASAFVIMVIAFHSASQDLHTSVDLQDSPLSLNLTKTIPITVNNQTQQLVISQYGIFNQVTVNQMANAANSIDISQDGISNVANVMQLGYGNTVNINQLGNNNLAEVIQDGDANIANIWQEGEQTFVVHQIGNNMVVNITQY